MQATIKAKQDQKNEYQARHDEMFSSVSTLNARIEELEQHKMHLLAELKSMGNKGGLDYIIKT
jgi:L-rhamnose mutarotase